MKLLTIHYTGFSTHIYIIINFLADYFWRQLLFQMLYGLHREKEQSLAGNGFSVV